MGCLSVTSIPRAQLIQEPTSVTSVPRAQLTQEPRQNLHMPLCFIWLRLKRLRGEVSFHSLQLCGLSMI